MTLSSPDQVAQVLLDGIKSAFSEKTGEELALDYRRVYYKLFQSKLRL